jgi:hypothetical protein
MVRKIEFWLLIPAITNIWQIGIDYTTIYISTSMKNGEARSKADDSKLMNELRINDEKLNKEMHEKLLDPTTVLNILIEKLQMYSQIESSLIDPVNMLYFKQHESGSGKSDDDHTNKK